MTDEALFNRMIDDHLPMWRQVALRVLGNPDDADDAVQQALCKAWCGREHFRSGAKLSSWIYRIVVNTSYDFLRKRMRDREKNEHFSREYQPTANEGREEALQRLYRAIGKLEEPFRETVTLYIATGLNAGEAAERLGCSLGTLYWRMHKAKKFLKQLLKESDHE